MWFSFDSFSDLENCVHISGNANNGHGLRDVDAVLSFIVYLTVIFEIKLLYVSVNETCTFCTRVTHTCKKKHKI